VLESNCSPTFPIFVCYNLAKIAAVVRSGGKGLHAKAGVGSKAVLSSKEVNYWWDTLP
jgi:hypothetical protein